MRAVLLLALASLVATSLAGCMDAFPRAEDPIPRPAGWEAPPLPEIGADLPAPPAPPAGGPGLSTPPLNPTQCQFTSARHYWQSQVPSDPVPQPGDDAGDGVDGGDGAGSGGSTTSPAWSNHRRIPYEVGYEDWLRVTYGPVHVLANDSQTTPYGPPARIYVWHEGSEFAFGPGVEVLEGEYDLTPPYELHNITTYRSGSVEGWVVMEVKIRFTDYSPSKSGIHSIGAAFLYGSGGGAGCGLIYLYEPMQGP